MRNRHVLYIRFADGVKVLMSTPLQAFCWVQGVAGALQNSSVDLRPKGSHAAVQRYRLPVEM